MKTTEKLPGDVQTGIAFLLPEQTARKKNYLMRFNQWVAIRLTRIFSAMPTFWCIITWITAWIVANLTIVHFDPPPYLLLLTIVSVMQIPLMIVILVGQSLQGRQQEQRSAIQFETTEKSYAHLEMILNHLSTNSDQQLSLEEQIKQQTLLLQYLIRMNAGGFHGRENTHHFVPLATLRQRESA